MLSIPKKTLQTLGQVLTLSWRAGPHQFVFFFLWQGLQGTLPLVTGWITKTLFNFITQSYQTHQLSWHTVLWLLIAQVIVFILNQLLSPTTAYLSADLGRKLTLNVKQSIYHKLNTIDGLDCFEDPSFHSIIETTSQNAQYIPPQTLNVFGNLLQYLVTLLTFLGILLAISPWLTFIVCLSVVPQFLVQAKFGQQRFNLLFTNSGKERHAAYYGQVLSWLAYAKEVRLFQIGDYFLPKFVTTTREIHRCS